MNDSRQTSNINAGKNRGQRTHIKLTFRTNIEEIALKCKGDCKAGEYQWRRPRQRISPGKTVAKGASDQRRISLKWIFTSYKNQDSADEKS